MTNPVRLDDLIDAITKVHSTPSTSSATPSSPPTIWARSPIT
jgi:hypothetical protein